LFGITAFVGEGSANSSNGLEGGPRIGALAERLGRRGVAFVGGPGARACLTGRPAAQG
jgi:hypothetical protein